VLAKVAKSPDSPGHPTSPHPSSLADRQRIPPSLSLRTLPTLLRYAVIHHPSCSSVLEFFNRLSAVRNPSTLKRQHARPDKAAEGPCTACVTTFRMELPDRWVEASRKGMWVLRLTSITHLARFGRYKSTKTSLTHSRSFPIARWLRLNSYTHN
jgi:hypothetical protein